MSKIFDSVIIYGSGTTNSSTLETLNGNKINTFTIKDNGNVGIGTSSPTEKLEVFGKTKSTLLQMTSGATEGYLLTALDNQGNIGWLPFNNENITELPPVISIQSTPPISNIDGDRYLISGGTGIWSGKTNLIGEWLNPNWLYTTGVTDNTVFVTDTLTTVRYNGSNWVPYRGTAILQNGNKLNTSVNIGSNDNNDVNFRTSGTTRMTIKNNGNVGIGVSNPSYKLNVNGNTYIKSDKVGVYSFLKFDPDNTGDTNFILGYTAGLGSSFEVRSGSDTYLTNKSYYQSPSLYIESASSKMKLQHINSDTYLYLGSVGTGTSFNFVTSVGTNLMTIKGNGNVGIGTATPSEKLEVNGKTKTTTLQVTSGATSGYVLTATDSNGNMSWQEPQDLTKLGTGLTVHFSGKTIFNLPSSPISGNISGDTANAKLGMIQKIYHQSSVEPTFPTTWKLVGEGVYFTNELNIIYAEYVEPTWIEYWIIQQQ